MTDTTTQRPPSANSNLSPEVAAKVHEAVEHLNDHHRDTITFVARHASGREVETATIGVVTAHRIRLELAVDGGAVSHDLVMDQRATSLDDFHGHLLGLLEQARAAAPDAPMTSIEQELAEAAERPTHHTRVADAADLTPNLRAITLRGGLELFESHGGDQWLALLVPDPDTDQLPDDLTIQQWQAMDPDSRPPAATYTVRRFDTQRHELELWIVLHDHDRGVAAWARDARVSDHVAVTASHRSLHWPDELDHVLLAGDETALPAIAALLDELVGIRDVTVDVVVETFDAGHALDLPGPRETTVHWVFRGDDPPGTGSYLLDAVADLDLPADTFVFAATDTVRARELRTRLRARGLERGRVVVTGYWQPDP